MSWEGILQVSRKDGAGVAEAAALASRLHSGPLPSQPGPLPAEAISDALVWCTRFLVGTEGAAPGGVPDPLIPLCLAIDRLVLQGKLVILPKALGLIVRSLATSLNDCCSRASAEGPRAVAVLQAISTAVYERARGLGPDDRAALVSALVRVGGCLGGETGPAGVGWDALAQLAQAVTSLALHHGGSLSGSDLLQLTATMSSLLLRYTARKRAGGALKDGSEDAGRFFGVALRALQVLVSEGGPHVAASLSADLLDATRRLLGHGSAATVAAVTAAAAERRVSATNLAVGPPSPLQPSGGSGALGGGRGQQARPASAAVKQAVQAAQAAQAVAAAAVPSAPPIPDPQGSSRVRLAAVGLIAAAARASPPPAALLPMLPSLLPSHSEGQTLNPRPVAPTLTTLAVFDPHPRVRLGAAAACQALWESPGLRGPIASLTALRARDAKRPPRPGFVPLSEGLGRSMVQCHVALTHALGRESHAGVLAAVARALGELLGCAAGPARAGRFPLFSQSLLPGALGGIGKAMSGGRILEAARLGPILPQLGTTNLLAGGPAAALSSPGALPPSASASTAGFGFLPHEIGRIGVVRGSEPAACALVATLGVAAEAWVRATAPTGSHSREPASPTSPSVSAADTPPAWDQLWTPLWAAALGLAGHMEKGSTGGLPIEVQSEALSALRSLARAAGARLMPLRPSLAAALADTAKRHVAPYWSAEASAAAWGAKGAPDDPRLAVGALRLVGEALQAAAPAQEAADADAAAAALAAATLAESSAAPGPKKGGKQLAQAAAVQQQPGPLAVLARLVSDVVLPAASVSNEQVSCFAFHALGSLPALLTAIEAHRSQGLDKVGQALLCEALAASVKAAGDEQGSQAMRAAACRAIGKFSVVIVKAARPSADSPTPLIPLDGPSQVAPAAEGGEGEDDGWSTAAAPKKGKPGKGMWSQGASSAAAPAPALLSILSTLAAAALPPPAGAAVRTAGASGLALRAAATWALANLSDASGIGAAAAGARQVAAAVLAGAGPTLLQLGSDTERIRGSAIRALGHLISGPAAAASAAGWSAAAARRALLDALEARHPKTMWNACYAVGHLLRPEANSELAWQRATLRRLLDLCGPNTPYLKIRIHAASALLIGLRRDLLVLDAAEPPVDGNVGGSGVSLPEALSLLVTAVMAAEAEAGEGSAGPSSASHPQLAAVAISVPVETPESDWRRHRPVLQSRLREALVAALSLGKPEADTEVEAARAALQQLPGAADAIRLAMQSVAARAEGLADQRAAQSDHASGNGPEPDPRLGELESVAGGGHGPGQAQVPVGQGREAPGLVAFVRLVC